ncbi:MAG: RnfABCDGE type electron transport complex subunit D [Yoonia sp.]
MIQRTPYSWNSHQISAATFSALLLPLITTVTLRGPSMVLTMVIALGASLLWSFLFSALRKSAFNWHSPISALIFVLLLPVATPIWQLVISLSFGLVFGDLIFGSRGRGFLNAAVVGLAFLLFSFPATPPDTALPQTAIAAALSGLILLALGLISWRIIAAFGICLAALIPVLPASANWQDLQSATVILGLIFLIGDPVAGANTHLGRWLYGALAAALVLLLGQTGVGIGSLSSVVFGALLASIFAPLLDQIAIYDNVRRRMKRQSYEP